MAASDGFKQALRNGDIASALKLAISEAIELKVTTWVASPLPNGASPTETGQTQTGQRMQTRLNIIDGDINNEVGSAFLNNGPYKELRSFHLKQVQEGRDTIRQNLSNLQQLISLCAKALRKDEGAFVNQSPTSQPDYSPPQLPPTTSAGEDLTVDPLYPPFEENADLTADWPDTNLDISAQPGTNFNDISTPPIDVDGMEDLGGMGNADGVGFDDSLPEEVELEPEPLADLLPDEFYPQLDLLQDSVPGEFPSEVGIWEDVPLDIAGEESQPDEDVPLDIAGEVSQPDDELAEAPDSLDLGELEDIPPDEFDAGAELLEDIPPDEFGAGAELLEDIPPDEFSSGAELLEDLPPDEFQPLSETIEPLTDLDLENLDPLADVDFDNVEVLSDNLPSGGFSSDLDIPEEFRDSAVEDLEEAEPLVVSEIEPLVDDMWESGSPVEVPEEKEDLNAGMLPSDPIAAFEDPPLASNWEEPLSLQLPEDLPDLDAMSAEQPDPLAGFEIDPLAEDVWGEPSLTPSNLQAQQSDMENPLDAMSELNQFADAWEEEDEDETVMNLPDSDGSSNRSDEKTDPMEALFGEISGGGSMSPSESAADREEKSDPLAALFGETPVDPPLSLYETDEEADTILEEPNPFADFPDRDASPYEDGEIDRWAELDEDVDGMFNDNPDPGLASLPTDWQQNL